jgi:hypothetical protein
MFGVEKTAALGSPPRRMIIDGSTVHSNRPTSPTLRPGFIFEMLYSGNEIASICLL